MADLARGFDALRSGISTSGGRIGAFNGSRTFSQPFEWTQRGGQDDLVVRWADALVFIGFSLRPLTVNCFFFSFLVLSLQDANLNSVEYNGPRGAGSSITLDP